MHKIPNERNVFISIVYHPETGLEGMSSEGNAAYQTSAMNGINEQEVEQFEFTKKADNWPHWN